MLHTYRVGLLVPPFGSAFASLALLLSLSACSSTEDGGTDAGTGPGGEIECGELTCGGDEFCLHRDSPPLAPPVEETVECATAPSGCNVQSLCDCEATETTWEGDPVQGCSILGSRELYVTGAACGSAPCAANEGCIAFGSSFSAPELAANNYCFALPDGCEANEDFCDTDCAERLAEAAGETYSGCFATTWGVAAMVATE